jgi:hypothetical protein
VCGLADAEVCGWVVRMWRAYGALTYRGGPGPSPWKGCRCLWLHEQRGAQVQVCGGVARIELNRLQECSNSGKPAALLAYSVPRAS